jgi:hypothetical protein
VLQQTLLLGVPARCSIFFSVMLYACFLHFEVLRFDWLLSLDMSLCLTIQFGTILVCDFTFHVII